MASPQAKTTNQSTPTRPEAGSELACLEALEKKVLWLSAWMIHNANHLRAEPRRAEGRRAPGVVAPRSRRS